MNPNSYVQEITKIQTEISRLNGVLKQLRIQQRHAKNKLYQYMIRNELTKVGTYTLKSCEPPKLKTKAKPKKEKKKAAIELFRDIGIPDPEKFYRDFEATQKYHQEDLF